MRLTVGLQRASLKFCVFYHSATRSGEGWDSGRLRPRPHVLPVRPPSGKKLGFTIDNGKLHNVSLGQGQEVVAEDALDMAAEMGHWVILQVRGPWRLPHHIPCARSAERRAVVV